MKGPILQKIEYSTDFPTGCDICWQLLLEEAKRKKNQQYGKIIKTSIVEVLLNWLKAFPKVSLTRVISRKKRNIKAESDSKNTYAFILDKHVRWRYQQHTAISKRFHLYWNENRCSFANTKVVVKQKVCYKNKSSFWLLFRIGSFSSPRKNIHINIRN